MLADCARRVAALPAHLVGVREAIRRHVDSGAAPQAFPRLARS